MSKTSKSLADAKEKLKKSNPDFFNKKSSSIKKRNIKKDIETKKKIIKWNFKTNDLVKIYNFTDTDDFCVGLIISDEEYMNHKLEENFYFVLIDSNVKNLSGRRLRKI